jgi:hypothetical protein
VRPRLIIFMSDIKFSCPHCQQHIQADTGYAGLQINCPACNGGLIVPGNPAAPAPQALIVRTPASVPAPTQATAPASPPAIQRPAATGSGCPSCGTALPRGAVLCIHCGYNLVTGQRTVAGRPAALGKPADAHAESPWYKTAYPYVGAVIALLVLLFFLGRQNPVMMQVLVGVAAFYSVTVHIIVVVAAFKESVGTGFLTLCIPFYALYFVFKVCENDTLKVLYCFAMIINLSLRFLAKTAN